MFAGYAGRVGRPSITRRSSGPYWASASRCPAVIKRADWPAAEACPAEPNRDRLRLTLPPRCRQKRTEPPGPSRIERIAGTAEGLCERRFTVRTAAMAPGAVDRLEELITASDPDDDAGGGFLRELKADPGQPVTRVSARCSMGTSAGHGPGRGKRRPRWPAIQRQAPAYHVRWLVVSKLARRQGVGRVLVTEAMRRFVSGPGVAELVTFGAGHPGAAASAARVLL